MKVILLGSTGLTGNDLLNKLLLQNAITQIVTITRRANHLKHNKLTTIHFDNLNSEALLNLDIEAEIFITTLGTTIKKAKSKDNFYNIDFNLNFAFSRLAEKSSCKKLIVVSSKGANEKSIFFYSKVKGKLENACKNLSIPQIFFYRPSILIGNRKEKRLIENIFVNTYKKTKKYFPEKLKKQLASEVDNLTTKIVKDILNDDLSEQKINFIESSKI